MSFTSELTMAVKAPPITTPTAISSTLPRMAKALNSSKNFLMPLTSFSAIKKIHSFTPFMPQGNVFASMIADFWRDCKGNDSLSPLLAKNKTGKPADFPFCKDETVFTFPVQ